MNTTGALWIKQPEPELMAAYADHLPAIEDLTGRERETLNPEAAKVVAQLGEFFASPVTLRAKHYRHLTASGPQDQLPRIRFGLMRLALYARHAEASS